MIGTHDEAFETQADRDRAERANREAAACLREWDRRRLWEQAQADAALHSQVKQWLNQPMPLELQPDDPFAALNAKLDRVLALLERK